MSDGWLHTNSRKLSMRPRNRVTLQALANVNPGFALNPGFKKCENRLFATLKGLRG
jgi:hypothetical protein